MNEEQNINAFILNQDLLMTSFGLIFKQNNISIYFIFQNWQRLIFNHGRVRVKFIFTSLLTLASAIIIMIIITLLNTVVIRAADWSVCAPGLRGTFWAGAGPCSARTARWWLACRRSSGRLSRSSSKPRARRRTSTWWPQTLTWTPSWR